MKAASGETGSCDDGHGRIYLSRQIAYVLLDVAHAFDPATVIVPIELMAGSAGPKQARGAMTVRRAGDPIVVMTMPMPLPNEEWERPSLRASALWPEAPSVFAGHGAHLVVATLAESTDRLHADRLGTRDDPIPVFDWDALGTPLSVPKMS